MQKKILTIIELLGIALLAVWKIGWLPVTWLAGSFVVLVIGLCYFHHRLQRDCDDSDRTLLDRAEQLSKRGQQLQERQQKLHTMEQEYQTLAQTHQETVQRLDQTLQEHQSLQTQYKEQQTTWQNDLENSRQTHRQLQQEYHALQEKHLQDHTEFTQKFQDLHQTYLNLEAIRNQLQEEHNALKKQHQQLTQENSDLQGKAKKMQAQIEDFIHKEDEWIQQEQQWLEKDLISQQKIQELEYTTEMLRHPPEILQEFVQEIEPLMSEFEEKLQLLHQGTINRSILQELSQAMDKAKNKAHVLGLNSLLPQTEKVYTLLQILRHAQGNFRLEQMVEIHQETQRLVEMLRDYQTISHKIMETKPTEATEVPMPPSTAVQYSPATMYRLYRYFSRAVLCSSAYPMEIVRFIRQMDDLWQSAFSKENLTAERRHVFALDDVLERVLQSLRPSLQQRNVTLHVENELTPLLLYGDTCKITNLLAMFLTASLWRAEPTSTLKFQWDMAAEPGGASVRLSTSVTIRSTEAKVLDKLSQWRQHVQPYCRECNAYLISDKWGFKLELPGLLNTWFPESLPIGWWGNLAEVESNLNVVSRFFPLRWQLVKQEALPEAIRQNTLAGLLIEAPYWNDWLTYWRSVEASHLPLPTIGIVGKMEPAARETKEFTSVEDELSLPLNPADLKWYLFRCLDFWANQHLQNRLGNPAG